MTKIKTVLIIEDDRFIGEMYVLSLEQEGYEVNWQTTGKDGLNEALANHYDLILLDIMLPEEQGGVVLKKLRGNEDKIPNSRVLVLTNFDQDEDVRASMEAKVDGYLIKADITPRKLLEIISSMEKD